MRITHFLALFAQEPRAGRPPAGTGQVETAKAILQAVRESPGRPVGELVKRMSLGSGTIHYHLERLAEQKLIRTVVAGRRRLVFPLDRDGDARDARALSLVRGRTSRVVAEAILASPGCSILDVMASTGESARTVYYHVKLLKTAGLVLSASSKRYRALQPAPHLASILERSREEGGNETPPPR
ncbi:MAG TPA: helix-turn-helix domain-containing protein [Candidatus Thermoplasmatota archaeon]|nr:helix-turn-helix domain-containing protein [Candidatus Thermoplasmatota archaeon]